MEMTTITVKVGQKPTKEQMKEIRAAAKAPINYTPDCPESTPQALAEFAAMAQELRKKKRRQTAIVAIRLKPETFAKYKSLGKGYTSVMAEVLNYAAENPEILSKVCP